MGCRHGGLYRPRQGRLGLDDDDRPARLDHRRDVRGSEGAGGPEEGPARLAPSAPGDLPRGPVGADHARGLLRRRGPRAAPAAPRVPAREQPGADRQAPRDLPGGSAQGGAGKAQDGAAPAGAQAAPKQVARGNPSRGKEDDEGPASCAKDTRGAVARAHAPGSHALLSHYPGALLLRGLWPDRERRHRRLSPGPGPEPRHVRSR